MFDQNAHQMLWTMKANLEAKEEISESVEQNEEQTPKRRKKMKFSKGLEMGNELQEEKTKIVSLSLPYFCIDLIPSLLKYLLYFRQQIPVYVKITEIYVQD